MGVPGLGEHPLTGREARRLCPPRARAAGAHGRVLWAAGTQWVIAPQAGTVWRRQGWQAGAASPPVCHTPTGTACSSGDCAMPRLDQENWCSTRAGLSWHDMHPPHHAARCDGPPIRHVPLPLLTELPCPGPPTPGCALLPAGIFHLLNKVRVEARCQAARCSPFQDWIHRYGAPAPEESWQGAGASPGLSAACLPGQGSDLGALLPHTRVPIPARGGRHLCWTGCGVRDQT